MQIDFSVLIYNGKQYTRENPGIAIADYADLLDWKEERDERFWNKVQLHYEEKSQFLFTYAVAMNTVIKDIEKEVVNIIGFDWTRFVRSNIKTYILIDDEFVYVQDSLIRLDKIWEYYGVKKELKVFFIFSNQAGDIWNKDGVRFFMPSREQGCHNSPHIHVDYKHKYMASVCLYNGELLAGNLPTKVHKKAKEKIMGEQAFLLDCWNKRTDGLKVDVNQHFGICPIRSRHLSISSSISPKSSITKRSNAAI